MINSVLCNKDEQLIVRINELEMDRETVIGLYHTYHTKNAKLAMKKLYKVITNSTDELYKELNMDKVRNSHKTEQCD